MSVPETSIVNLDAGGADPALLIQIDAIFFEASSRKFEPGEERDAFRERWLGRYLEGGSDVALLAVVDEGIVAGYLVGALENPAESARFDDIAYFRTDFANLCRRFPAHLHINLAPAFRGKGLGSQLVAAFAHHAASHGVPGFHVVTGKGMRNVRFYVRCGLSPRATAMWNGREILFLGKELAVSPSGSRADRR